MVRVQHLLLEYLCGPSSTMSPLSLRPKFLQAGQADPSQGIRTWKEKRGWENSTLPCLLSLFDPHRIYGCWPPGNKNEKPIFGSPLAKWRRCLVSCRTVQGGGGGFCLGWSSRNNVGDWSGQLTGLCASCNPWLPGCPAARAQSPALAWRVGLAAPRIRQGRWKLGARSMSSIFTP